VISDEAIDRLLQARDVPTAPPQFTSRAMSTIRRESRRREQVIDIGFNLVMGVISITIALPIGLLLSQSGMVEASSQAFGLLWEQMIDLGRRAAPSVPLYAGAVAVVGTALGVWWWAERDPGIG
jgi:hypothetical protein